jgi:hypothetical protein
MLGYMMLGYDKEKHRPPTEGETIDTSVLMPGAGQFSGHPRAILIK